MQNTVKLDARHKIYFCLFVFFYRDLTVDHQRSLPSSGDLSWEPRLSDNVRSFLTLNSPESRKVQYPLLPHTREKEINVAKNVVSLRPQKHRSPPKDGLLPPAAAADALRVRVQMSTLQQKESATKAARKKFHSDRRRTRPQYGHGLFQNLQPDNTLEVQAIGRKSFFSKGFKLYPEASYPTTPIAPGLDRRGDEEKGEEIRIQEILPFPFSPNIRPLDISDLWSTHPVETVVGRSGYHDCILGSGVPEAHAHTHSLGG
ncbi:hypothetical protein FJTKL_02377 [Diaporthe vaccinii]|uniref:Uncharacterized protein n=1 Tax=Diaporthe vaccinii TaxID=105482 RepID=A0ABR4F3V2_9PEZI